MRSAGIVIHEPMLLTKDLIGAPVRTRDGELVGRVYDVHIRSGKVIGIVAGPEQVHFHDVINIAKAYKTIPHIIKDIRGLNKRGYISWKDIRKIKNGSFILESEKKIRFSRPKGISVIKRILDEQVTDKKGRYIGRVDEVQFIYTYGERTLSAVGFYSGASAMLRRASFGDVGAFHADFSKHLIPWKLIKKISSEPPTRIILKVRVK
jgi:sporulation protein YlmC with PRC-barrel domain